MRADMSSVFTHTNPDKSISVIYLAMIDIYQSQCAPSGLLSSEGNSMIQFAGRAEHE